VLAPITAWRRKKRRSNATSLPHTESPRLIPAATASLHAPSFYDPDNAPLLKVQIDFTVKKIAPAVWSEATK
jgi:hypothetical protein